MNDEMMPHHMAVLEDIQRKRDSLQEQLKSLEAIERYHQREIEFYKMLHPGEPPVSPTSRLYGKTLAEACEEALKMMRGGRSLEIADCLAVMFDYGDGSKNRSFVNALYNAMTRKPDTFENTNGVWTLHQLPAAPEAAIRNRITSKPR